MCCMLANPQQTEQETFLFSLLSGEGRGRKTEQWHCVQGAPPAIWPFCLGSVHPVFCPCVFFLLSQTLWHFEVHIWSLTHFAFSLSVQAWSLCILGLLIKYNVFKEKGEFMEEPVLFSLWKIPVPDLECCVLIAAWGLGEFFPVVAYICICCLGMEMGLLWAPGDCETNMFVMAQTPSSCRH